jgi:hypothetical protein
LLADIIIASNQLVAGDGSSIKINCSETFTPMKKYSIASMAASLDGANPGFHTGQ